MWLPDEVSARPDDTPGPSASPLRKRVFAALDPTGFERAFREWAALPGLRTDDEDDD